MNTLADLFALAMQHHLASRLGEAEPLYRQILQAEPQHVEALQLLGLILYQTGRTALAIEHLRAALRCKPDYAEVHNNLGSILSEQGQLDEALVCYQEAIRLKPSFAEAHMNRGNALKALGKLDDARNCYQRARQLKPNYAEASYNLGVLAMAQGQPDEAIGWYRQTLTIAPHFTRAHYNLGSTFMALGKPAEAKACYEQVLRLEPGHVAARTNLGAALKALGKLDEAIACHRETLRLWPDYAEAHYNLGNALLEQGNLAEAKASFEHALRLRPDFADAHNSLGKLFKEEGRHEEALTCFRRALRLRPAFVDALNNLGAALKDQGQISEALDCYRRALHSQPDPKHHSNLIFSLCYSPEHDAIAIAEEAARWNQQHAAPHAKSIQVHGNDRSPDRRLRVGYVSPDFREHAVGRNVWPLVREHDHSQFEIFCYSHLRKPDNLTRSFQGCADAWRDVADLNDDQLAQQVRGDRIDILVDLAVHTADNRLIAFAQKPSPIQVSFAGYPGTTGLTAIDYRLTDPYLDPPGQHDDWYSEQSLRLPESFWCYDPLGDELPVNTLPAITQGHLTFGCLNNFCKVNVAALKLWALVMQGIERSHLLLLAPEGSHRKQTIEFLAQHGISAERVTFIGFQPRLRYLELYHRIDLGLDTFPYNGHTTSLDALWMGVPVVTLVGTTVVGRAGLSQLTNVGLPELVAATPQQFVRIAVELAQDVPRLSRLRATLRERMQASPLMDARRFTRGIEAAYRMMWRRWCEQSS